MRLKILFWFLKEEFLEKILTFKKMLSSSVRFESKSQDRQYLSLARKREAEKIKWENRIPEDCFFELGLGKNLHPKSERTKKELEKIAKANLLKEGLQ